MSSITTRKDEKTDRTDQGITKRLTTTQEEKSRTETQQQTNKVFTGTLEQLAPIMKAEGLRYEPPGGTRPPYSSVRSQLGPPPPPKPVPVATTETRRAAFTTGPEAVCFPLIFSELLPL